MQLILSIFFAFFLVAAQSSWKIAVDKYAPFTGTTVAKVVSFVLSPYVIAGVFIYVMATILYMYMLSRYEFSTVQSLAIPLSLIFSIFVATTFFSERLHALNYIGVLVIAIGLIMVTQK